MIKDNATKNSGGVAELSERHSVESLAAPVTLEFEPRSEGKVRLINVPPSIYLQTGTAVCDAMNGDLNFEDLRSEDLTWCADEIEYGDVKYVLNEAYESSQLLIEQLVEALKPLYARLPRQFEPNINHQYQLLTTGREIYNIREALAAYNQYKAKE